MFFHRFLAISSLIIKQKQSMKFPSLKILSTLFIFSSLFAFSCVSPQQYDALLQENDFLEEENNVLREEVAFKEGNDIVETKLEADVIRLQREVEDTKKRYTALEKTYLELSSRYNLVVKDKGTTIGGTDINCQSELADIQRNIDDQNRQMRIIRLTLQQRESQIKDLERLLNRQAFSN